MQKIYSKDFIIVIPARWKSSRFPGKPLAQILGKSVIEYVYSSCLKATSKNNIIIATDDSRIKKFCISKNMNVVMSSKNCLTGTDRIIEISKKIKSKIYINVQGDEPLIKSNEIIKFIKIALRNKKKIIIGKSKIDKHKFKSKNIPKIVTDNKNRLLYISRACIPSGKKFEANTGYGQVNIYSYPRSCLKNKYKNKKTFNEKKEDIEILRFLENGHNVFVKLMKGGTHPIDEKKDLKIVKSILLKHK